MNYFRTISILLAFGLFIIMPFVYFPRLQDVEQTPRFLFLAIIILATTVLTIITLYIERKKESRTLVFDSIYIILFAWLFICSLSLIQSINFSDAQIEYLKIFMFLSLFFLFLITLHTDETNRTVFYRSIVVSALFLIGIGAFQFWNEFAGYDVNQISSLIGFITSSLGNKNFFSETLLLMLPFILLNFLEKSKFWKVASVVATIGILITLMLLQTLSTWLAITISGTVVMLNLFNCRHLLFETRKQMIRWAALSGTLFIGLVIFVVMFFFFTDSSGINKRIQDFSSIINRSKVNTDAKRWSSLDDRIIMYENAVRVFSDQPFTGVGLANLKIIAPVFGLGSADHIASGSTVYTHPHNEFLLVAGESGIIGLLIYILIFVWLIAYVRRLSKTSNSRKELIFSTALLFALINFIMIAMVSLPSTRFYPMILLMFTAALIISERSRRGMIQKKVRINIVILICIMIMAPAAISISKGSKRLNADIALSKALIAERKRNYPFMKKLLLKIDKEIYPIDVNVTPIAWYLGFSEFYLQERSAAFEHFKEAERVNPNHLMVLNDLATSYNLSGDVNMAIKYYKKALSIQPEFGDAIVNLSIVYYNQGMLDEAYNTIIKHITIVEPHQVVVFKTILTAKALNITGTDQLPPDFEGHFKSVDSVKDLLLMIRGFNGKLEVLL